MLVVCNICVVQSTDEGFKMGSAAKDNGDSSLIYKVGVSCRPSIRSL